eukprot:6987640-Ditylum_brightwellii.AAC.1
MVVRQAEYTANNAKYVKQDDEMQQRTAEALASLAETTTTDRAAVANLSEYNTELVNHVVSLSKQVKDKDLQMDKMQKA